MKGLIRSLNLRLRAPNSVAARVDRGWRLLDDEGPDNWQNLIDVDQLNQASGTCCVLGQLHGHYNDALHGPRHIGTGWPQSSRKFRARVRAAGSEAFGFCAGHYSDYDKLNATWRNRLQEYQAAHPKTQESTVSS